MVQDGGAFFDLGEGQFCLRVDALSSSPDEDFVVI